MSDIEEDPAFVRAAMQSDLDQKDAEIERLRAALTIAHAYIKDEGIAHAVVLAKSSGEKHSTLLGVIDAALAHQQQEKVTEPK